MYDGPVHVATGALDERNADLEQLLEAFYLAPVRHEQDDVVVGLDDRVVMRDDDLVVAMVDDVRELLGEEPDVERVEHRTHARDREIGLHVLLVVPHERADPIARLEATVDERCGQSLGLRSKSGKSDLCLSLAQRNPAKIWRRCGRSQLRKLGRRSSRWVAHEPPRSTL